MKLWNYIQNKPYIIAEAGVNHLCDWTLAKALISGARFAGADAIKFQSYKAEKLCTKDAPRFWDWNGEKPGTQYDSYSQLDGFGADEHRELARICRYYEIDFMSTPFDNEAVDYLDEHVRAFKIASCDITNFPLIEHIAKKGKIVILSTGASNLDEIKNAVNLISEYTEKIVIMHCNLDYPTGAEDINLSMITTLNQDRDFDKYVLGLSDHTIGTLAPALAYMLGATVIEKHFTVDKTLGKSADHWLSADIIDMKEIVKNVNLAHKMIGTCDKVCTESELRTKKFARRSIVAIKDIKEDEVFTGDNISCKRPGTGISPIHYNKILGCKATKNIKNDELLKFGDVYNLKF